MYNDYHKMLAAGFAGLMLCVITSLHAMEMSLTLESLETGKSVTAAEPAKPVETDNVEDSVKSAETAKSAQPAVLPTLATPDDTLRMEGSAEKPVAEQKPVLEENHFNVFEYRISGNTVLTASAIEDAVYFWMGENKTIADVEKAREGLEKAYHSSGYLTVLVDIPEQDVKQGIVRLNVTEGKVDHLRVRGSRYYSLGYIKTLASSLAEGEVPYFPQVQKEVASLNRTEDRRVTPVMKAGRTFGTVDVDLKVDDNLPLHGSVEMNDQYSKNTERWRLSGMIRYDNLWQRDHSLTLQFQTAPQNTSQVKMLSASYLYRFDDSDRMLALYGVKSDSNVATFGGINVLGNGTIFGARLVIPLASIKDYTHSFSVGADYKDFQQNILFGTDTAKTPISYLPFSVQYSATSQDEKGITQYALGTNFALRGVVGKESEFNSKRAGAASNYMVLKPEVQRTQPLPQDFQFWGKLDAQLANGQLISNEQYVAGGANSVRGYLEAEAAGDNALHASLELRSPTLLHRDWLQDFRFVGFYDIATLRVVSPTATDREQHTIAGTGMGIHLKAQKYWNASVSVARALHDASMTIGDNSGTQNGKIAGHVRLWYEF